MFLIYFLVFILLFTVFENITLAGISLALVMVWLVIYQSVSGKKILSRQMSFSLFGAFLLAWISFGIKERRYYGTSPFAVEGTMSQSPWSNSLFVWSGIINDISGQGKYVFEIEKKEYLLYSEKKYAIGDQLRLVGNFQNAWGIRDQGQGERNKGQGNEYWNITKKTFAVPIFSWGFDYPKRLKMKWWQGTIYEKNSLQLKVWSLKLEAVWIIQSMKKSIQEKIIAAYGENKVSGLILGMLIGDKSQIPEAEYQQFVDSGLVHLIAVSGWNILMIVVFLQFILFFLPFYVRIVIILITITGYSLVCGMDSSVFRALLMGGLSMVALFRGREINIWRLLSISALIMLIINPYFLAYDTGFLLSYAAIIGLVYFNEETNKCENVQTTQWWNDKAIKCQQNRFQKWLVYVYKNYISPSIWASIGIFPIIMFFMGKMNLLGIVGNLFVLPIVPFVMIYGFFSVWLYQIFHRSRLLWVEKILVIYIYKISELLTTYGLYISVTGLWVKYLFLAWFLTLFIVRRVKSNKKLGKDW